VVWSRQTTSSTSGAVCPAEQVATKVVPSVVTISAHKGRQSGTGSGGIIRSDGDILTNDHVVSVAADGGSIDVLFADGRTAPATLVGRDPKTDLAVIKVADIGTSTVIPFGDSSALAVGQPVVAVGAPLGLSGTVTSGIVSALGRDVTVPGDNGDTALLIGAVQTDASINPGNSGGPLVDCSGRLVGVNSAIATLTGGGSVGLGFAIPSNLAKSLSDQIIATGKVSYAYMGVVVTPISPAVARRTNVGHGLYVDSVVPGGPAESGGLQSGDVLTDIDGRPLSTVDDLLAVLVTHQPGDKVKVTYVRNGQSSTTTVTLAAQP